MVPGVVMQELGERLSKVVGVGGRGRVVEGGREGGEGVGEVGKGRGREVKGEGRIGEKRLELGE